VRLIEAVNFVLHIFPKAVDLGLGEPNSVKIASALVFGEVLIIVSIFSFSSP
jgi:hypothetical protein